MRERTEFFLRENPVPTVLGALRAGIGDRLVAIRYSSHRRAATLGGTCSTRNRLEHDSPAFILGFCASVKRGYADSAEAVKGGLERVKDWTSTTTFKPLRKR